MSNAHISTTCYSSGSSSYLGFRTCRSIMSPTLLSDHQRNLRLLPSQMHQSTAAATKSSRSPSSSRIKTSLPSGITSLCGASLNPSNPGQLFRFSRTAHSQLLCHALSHARFHLLPRHRHHRLFQPRRCIHRRHPLHRWLWPLLRGCRLRDGQRPNVPRYAPK